MIVKPTLTPVEALNKVSDMGSFTHEAFLYDLGDDDMSVTAENLVTGVVWACSGDYDTPVDENTFWVNPDE